MEEVAGQVRAVGFTRQESRMMRAMIRTGSVSESARRVGVCRSRGHALLAQVRRRITAANPERGNIPWASYVPERTPPTAPYPPRRKLTGTRRAAPDFSPLSLAVAN
jgi:hypothetical protein